MAAIPFGIAGVIFAFALHGESLGFVAIMGIIGLGGVVVNDSLVLVSHINTSRWGGVPLRTAVSETGRARFRPILLTSLTTAASVTPLILEKSVQAKFLVPMAVGLAGGVLFSTAITLLLVPCGYLILEDLRRVVRWLAGRPEPAPDTQAEHERRDRKQSYIEPLPLVTAQSGQGAGDDKGQPGQRLWGLGKRLGLHLETGSAQLVDHLLVARPAEPVDHALGDVGADAFDRLQIIDTGAELLIAPCANCKKQLKELIEYHKIDIEFMGLHDLLYKVVQFPEEMITGKAQTAGGDQ